MTEVRIILLDPQEIQWYAQFVNALLVHRRPQADTVTEPPPADDKSALEKAGEALGDAMADATIAHLEKQRAQVIAEITPEGHTPTNAEMEAALKTFYQAHGIAAARALLDEYGAKRVTDVKPEQRAELVGRLS
jgi:hypothetical protein